MKENPKKTLVKKTKRAISSERSRRVMASRGDVFKKKMAMIE